MTKRRPRPGEWGMRLARELIAQGRLPPDALTPGGRPGGVAVAPPGVALLRPPRALPWEVTLYGAPRTKKNSLQRWWSRPDAAGRRRKLTIPSQAFLRWQDEVQPQLERAWAAGPLARPVAVRALVYRATAVHGDLVGYQQALGDVLQRAGVLADDELIASWDGTRRRLDRDLPRVEVRITYFEESA